MENVIDKSLSRPAPTCFPHKGTSFIDSLGLDGPVDRLDMQILVVEGDKILLPLRVFDNVLIGPMTVWRAHPPILRESSLWARTAPSQRSSLFQYSVNLFDIKKSLITTVNSAFRSLIENAKAAIKRSSNRHLPSVSLPASG